jgi:hypothetical protein
LSKPAFARKGNLVPDSQHAVSVGIDVSKEYLDMDFESVASLPGIVVDTMNVLRYFPGPKLAKEGDHAGTGRISGGSDGRDHTC